MRKCRHSLRSEYGDGAGDGDLGITITRGMEAIAEVADDLSEDLGLALLKCSQAFINLQSGGTLMALAMMAIAKQIKGQTMIAPSDLNGFDIARIDPHVAAEPVATVLDSLDAIVQSVGRSGGYPCRSDRGG